MQKNDPYSNFSKGLKERIRKRDNYTCKACGKDLHGNNFGGRVHHIDGDKTNSSENNLVYVCRKCHSLIHSKISLTDTLLAFRSMLV